MIETDKARKILYNIYISTMYKTDENSVEKRGKVEVQPLNYLIVILTQEIQTKT